MKKYLLYVITIISLVSAACKPLPPFHQDREANKSEQFSAIKNRLPDSVKTPLNSTGKPIIIMQTKMPRAAVCVSPETGKVLWKTATPSAVSRYTISGTIVAYYDSKKGITALDIQTGNELWTSKLKPGREFLGMSGDQSGKLAVVSYSKQGGSALNQISELTLLSSGGKVIYSVDTQGRMGWPLLSSRFIAVPYRSQYLVFMDLSKPIEIGRIHVKKGEVRFVKQTENGIFFGDKSGTYSLAEVLKKGSDIKTLTVSSEIKNLEYKFAADHYSSIMKDYSAYDLRMMHGNFISTEKGTDFSGNSIVFNLFRYFFGFSVNNGKGVLKWAVRVEAENLAAVESFGDRLFYITASGAIGALNISSGEIIWKTEDIVENIRGATLDLNGFTPPASSTTAPMSLLDSLTAVANDVDTRFPLAKRFAIDALAVVGGAGVARLLSMITDPRSSSELKEKAEKDLIERPDPKGLPLYLNLISTSFDFINKTRPKAIIVMSKVLAKLKSPEAVPLLLKLLVSPDINIKELNAVVEALIEIGDQRAVRPFREFLLAYRADPEFARDIHPLQKMAEGLFKMGKSAERQVLTFLSEDPRTLPRLQEYILRMLKKTRVSTAKK
ncbi:PQQ-binding-like beta-propeller repeat protein [Myxococcota bacterium]|nr:PQQ-binding-like beta-propeller repeat protein [Myxococcota bacterium]MBU1379711.1 PQQ-binding-like beta-propeller repeat protein [Myxococcota bacterium]MBU1496131.1 PQQ-binding-like beta-propeller repeat protein [Myxococcota bacterium]